MTLVLLLCVFAGEPVEARSLFGTPLTRPVMSAERKADFEGRLAKARADAEANPSDPMPYIWIGRHLAYLGRYGDAVAAFGQGIKRFPEDARFYRHRGHRYISTRQFDKAVADFEKAAQLVEGKADQVEPDGLPNAAGIPTSTLQTNIYYHLGLAHYLKGDFDAALSAYRRCLDLCTNNDMAVATRDWLYMTLRRLGRDAEAAKVLEPVTADMKLLESFSYHKRLLMYRGQMKAGDLLKPPSDDPDPTLAYATQGYGVGNWYLYQGQKEKAIDVYRKVLDTGYWSAFGYLAAEADLHRLGVKP